MDPDDSLGPAGQASEEPGTVGEAIQADLDRASAIAHDSETRVGEPVDEPSKSIGPATRSAIESLLSSSQAMRSMLDNAQDFLSSTNASRFHPIAPEVDTSRRQDLEALSRPSSAMNVSDLIPKGGAMDIAQQQLDQMSGLRDVLAEVNAELIFQREFAAEQARLRSAERKVEMEENLAARRFNQKAAIISIGFAAAATVVGALGVVIQIR